MTVRRSSKLQKQLLNTETYNTAQVQVLNLDAGVYLRQAGLQPADVVIIDFPDPQSQELAKLYGHEFYTDLARMLAPGAIVAVQSTSPYHARDAFLCIGKTMRSAGYAVVPYQANVPSFGQWGWHIAVRGNSLDAELLHQRMQQVELPISTRYLTPQLIAASTAFGHGVLDDQHIAINSALRPVIVDYYRHAWSR